MPIPDIAHRQRREVLPFRCPFCGHRSHFAYREPTRRLIAVYHCKRCGAQVVPDRYWLTMLLVCFLVFPATMLAVIGLSVWLELRVGVSVWLAAGTGVAVAVIAFQLLARALLTWRPHLR
jgi:predicted RNA-binding Zn-ribbon protein involved in translation (DUF1610 family)